MKQFFKIFKFEFLNIIRSKAFIFLTVLLFLGSTAALFFPRLTNTQGDDDSESPQKIAVFAQDRKIAEYLKSALYGTDVTVCDSEKSASELLESKTVDAAVSVTSPLNYTYTVTDMGLYDMTTDAISEALQQRYRNIKLAEYGLSEEEIIDVQSALAVPEYKIVGQDQSQSFMYTYILLFILYIAVVAYGQMIAQSVATEKSSRAMELLITSAKPDSLIFGKVLGTGFAGLSQIVFILLWSIICYKINAPLWEDVPFVASIFDMPLSLIAYAAVFFILGFLIYAFLYGALGSLASKMEDIGTLTMPLTFVMVIAFMIPITSISAGRIDTLLMKILSYIPFCSPMAMFARISMSTVNPVEIIISISVLILSNIAIGYVAVAIYRMGILMYGKPPKFTQILKLLKK